MPNAPRRFRPAVQALEDRSVPAAIGSLDPTFGNAGKLTLNFGPNDVLNAMAVQSDGKVVVAGTTGNGTGDFVVARILANGALDPSFGSNGIRFLDLGGNDIGTGLVIQPDGKIVVGGYSTINGTEFGAVARFNGDGSSDATFAGTGQRLFNSGQGSTEKVYAIALNNFGGIYLAGTRAGDLSVTRVDPFGNLDRAYGTEGVARINLGGVEEARGIVVLSDGRVVLGGSTTAPSILANPAPGEGTSPTPRPNDFVAVRLATDGRFVDFGFGNTVLNGNKAAVVDFAGDARVFAVTQQADGKIILAGTDGGAGADFAIARLDGAGQLDASFSNTGLKLIGFGGTDEARTVLVQGDGRIVVAGYSANDRSTVGNFAVARLNANGSEDGTFGGLKTFDFGGDDRANASAIDTRGRLLVVGRTGGDSAAARIESTVGLPSSLTTAGTPDGSGKQFALANGQYGTGQSFTVFPGFAGSIHVATGDINGDGVADRIAGAGAGGGPAVAIYDGKTGGLIANFFAFEQTFLGGVYVAASDFNGDGRAELIVTADVGGGPRVRIFDGTALLTNTPQVIADFFGIADPNFRGGTRPTVGDINGDGIDELIIAAGVGGGPRISVFDGKSITSATGPANIVPDFFAFEESVRNGAYVSAGDVDGDGADDLIFGAGPGGAARVRIISGSQLLRAGAFGTIDAAVGLQIASYIAGPSEARGGVTVTAKDVDGDNKADVVTGSGVNLRSEVRVYKGTTILGNSGNPTPDQVLDPYGAEIPASVFVG